MQRALSHTHIEYVICAYAQTTSLYIWTSTPKRRTNGKSGMPLAAIKSMRSCSTTRSRASRASRCPIPGAGRGLSQPVSETRVSTDAEALERTSPRSSTLRDPILDSTKWPASRSMNASRRRPSVKPGDMMPSSITKRFSHSFARVASLSKWRRTLVARCGRTPPQKASCAVKAVVQHAGERPAMAAAAASSSSNMPVEAVFNGLFSLSPPRERVPFVVANGRCAR